MILQKNTETLMILAAAYRLGVMDKGDGTVPKDPKDIPEHVWELMQVFAKKE